MENVNVRLAQQPLRALYRSTPAAALVTDHARTAGENPGDPYRSVVEPMTGSKVTVPVGVHRGLGGPHDAPTPGDILCGALAACQDSSVRMVANILGVDLESLVVEVSGEVDLRGTMAVDPQVFVGFQAMSCHVRLRAKEGTDPVLLQRLHAAAERSCVVLQTLRRGVSVQTAFSEDPRD